jgi:hypothetical protein
MGATQWQTLGSGPEKCPDRVAAQMPFERQCPGCYWTLHDTASRTDMHKIILKLEIPIISWAMSEKHSPNISAQKYWLFRTTWPEELGGSHDADKQASYFPLRPM